MTTPAQEKIDLSHYDLKNDFLLYEAACLIAGIDPYAQKLNDLCISPESTRVQTTLAAMHEAHKSAATAFTDMAFSFEITSDRRPVYDPWSIKKEQGEPMPPVLPSINMHDWLYCFKRYRDTSKLNLRISPSKDKFKREDITQWLQAKGYKQACYFLKDLPAHGSAKESDLQEQIKRLQEQVKQFESQAKELETLKQENAELKAQAEELGASQDIDPRLKNTLYKMIYAMAKDCYKYDPRAPRNDATNDIYLAIADAKLSLGKDAIREHLKESAKLAS